MRGSRTKLALVILGAGLLLLPLHPLDAQSATCQKLGPDDIQALKERPPAVFVPEITLPGFSSGQGVPITSTTLAEYIRSVFVVMIWSVGVLAVVMIIFGGVKWVAAAGNPGRINDAKDVITNSLIGLIIALTSVVLLGTINPDLASLPGVGTVNVAQCIRAIESDYGPVYQSGALPKGIVEFKVETTSGDRVIRANQSIMTELQQVFHELVIRGFDVRSISDFRPESTRCHGQGLAIDINIDQNYCIDCYDKKNARVGKYYRPASSAETEIDRLSVDQGVVENIFKRHGFCWGGDWRSFKDYMHFSHKSCNMNECAEGGKFDFNKSVEENHRKYDITYP